MTLWGYPIQLPGCLSHCDMQILFAAPLVSVRHSTMRTASTCFVTEEDNENNERDVEGTEMFSTGKWT